MWMVTTTGFYSVVSAGKGRVQVRARDRLDLMQLRWRFKLRNRIVSTPHADYPFRMFLPAAKWPVIAGKLAKDAAGYTNFKDAVAQGDAERAEVYHGVWRALRDIEGEDFGGPMSDETRED